jgi:hypothetical protein
MGFFDSKQHKEFEKIRKEERKKKERISSFFGTWEKERIVQRAKQREGEDTDNFNNNKKSSTRGRGRPKIGIGKKFARASKKRPFQLKGIGVREPLLGRGGGRTVGR